MQRVSETFYLLDAPALSSPVIAAAGHASGVRPVAPGTHNRDMLNG